MPAPPAEITSLLARWSAGEEAAFDRLVELVSADLRRLARVVECRILGGMTGEETARALGVSIRTVERDWTRARTDLWRDPDPSPPATPDSPGLPDD